MAIAGKVAITLSNENDGKWSASVTYDRLTAVTHNNNLYISKKPSTNVEPTVTDEFWFLALKGFSGEDVQTLVDSINNIIGGTTQVGNAKTLDGHKAEYFQERNGDGRLRTAFDANTFTDSGRYSHGVAELGTNIPSTGTFIIDNCGTYIVQTVISYDTPPKIYVRISVNGGSTWGAWSDRLVTTADLANHIPNYYTGATTEELDTIFNDLHANALPESVYEAIVNVGFGGYVLGGGAYYVRGYRSTSGNYGWQKATIYSYDKPPLDYKRNMYNGTWRTWHLEDYLSNTGGTVDGGGSMNPLSIKGGATTSLLRYYNSASELQGYLGFINNKPVFQSNTNTASELLHTGNKPTGTYTGNGDATERVINTGGVGSILAVWGGGAIIFITSSGIMGATNNQTIDYTLGKWVDGNYTIKTDHVLLNRSGIVYSWAVL